MRGFFRAIPIVLVTLTGCSHLEQAYRSVDNAPLTGPTAPLGDTACNATATAPAYDLGHLKDCTAPDTFVVFAFSGGGIRSAAFGYGALTAAHGAKIGEDKHPLTQDIDVVTGVSGGSFTAAAFATHRESLFPAPDGKDYYRDNFLTHDFFADLASIYLAPWHWQWMLPYYTAQDELAKIYGAMPFSSPSDPVFAKTYADLAQKGRPLLVVQATDYGNEQPFTFTQPDFDLICSDLGPYPVGNAVAASSAFPVLFSPIRLTNHHHNGTNDFCATHRPAWVDRVLDAPEPEDLSRLYTRARVANDYLPPKPGAPKPKDAPRSVFLQDGGVVDNVALRGFSNMALPFLGGNGDKWPDDVREALCKSGWNRIKHIVVVVVDGEAQPSNKIASLPYLSDLLLILNVTSSAMIDANGFETMLATDALTKQMARQTANLNCTNSTAPAATETAVTAWFARVSFQDLAEDTVLPPEACDRHAPDGCTLGDIARSDTSLAFSQAEVDALVAAGRSAFQCNAKLRTFFKAMDGTLAAQQPLACRKRAGLN